MQEQATTMRELEGQLCVVTGGSKGIGFAIAERYVAAGARVVIAARDEGDLARAAEQLEAVEGRAGEVVVQRLDVSDRASVEALFARVDELGPLNVLVANAGSGSIVPFLDLDDELWDRTIGLNLTGTFACMRGAARRMVAQGGGNRSIIAVSSIRGLGARPGTAHYAASKAGLNQLARVAAYELAPEGVRVNVLSPGITDTPLASVNDEVRDRMLQHVPMGRVGHTDDMAQAALYLASPRTGFVTGTNLVVDGGESLW
ncbi:SDR family oxidoreductase [Nocardioides zeae]